MFHYFHHSTRRNFMNPIRMGIWPIDLKGKLTKVEIENLVKLRNQICRLIEFNIAATVRLEVADEKH